MYRRLLFSFAAAAVLCAVSPLAHAQTADLDSTRTTADEGSGDGVEERAYNPYENEERQPVRDGADQDDEGEESQLDGTGGN